MAYVVDDPMLTTERLHLRPLRLDDFSWNKKLIYSDPGVTWDGTAGSPAQTLRAVERRLDHWREHGFGMWAVTERDKDEPFGFAGLQTLDSKNEVEVGYYLGRSAWGKGYATEAGRAVIRYGFEVLKLARVVAVVRPENVASQRVLSKLGLSHVRNEEHYGFMTQLWSCNKDDAR